MTEPALSHGGRDGVSAPVHVRHLAVIASAIFLAAFSLRLGATAALIGIAAPPKGEANPDQIDYELFAAQMAAGNGYAWAPGEPTASRPPGTSFALYPVYLAVGHSFLAARIWFCFLSAATCLATWWAAYPAFGHRTGLVAAAIVAIYPGHLYYALHFLSEVPAALALAVGTGLAIRTAVRPPGWLDFVHGAVWGFVILVRPNFLLAFLLIAGISVWKTDGWRRRSLRLALLAAGSGIVVGPWVVRNQRTIGKPTLCTIVAAYTFWGANNPRTYDDPRLVGYWVPTSELKSATQPLVGSEPERESAAWSYGKEFALNHLGELPRVVAHRVLRVVWAYSESTNRTVDLAFRYSWFVLLPFVLVGLARMTVGSPRSAWIFAAPLIATLLTAVIFYGCSRFRDTCAPQLATFAVVGAFGCRDRAIRPVS